MNLTGSIKRAVLGMAIAGSAVLAGGGVVSPTSHAASAAFKCFPVACTPNPQPIQQISYTLAQRLTHCRSWDSWVSPMTTIQLWDYVGNYPQRVSAWVDQLLLVRADGSATLLIQGTENGAPNHIVNISLNGAVHLTSDTTPGHMTFTVSLTPYPFGAFYVSVNPQSGPIDLDFSSGSAQAFTVDTGLGAQTFTPLEQGGTC